MPVKSRRGLRPPGLSGLSLAAVLLFFGGGPRPWAQTELPLWRFALGGIVTGPPQTQAGSVAVILDSGNLKAFSTQGRPLWSYYSQGRLSPFLTRSPEGHSYIARTDGILIAVNRVGRELWRSELGAPLSGPPVCGWDGRLFVPAGKSVSCFTAAGRRLWHWPLGSPMAIPPVLDQDGGIVTVLESAILLRLGPFGEIQTLYLSAVPKAIVPLGSPENGGRVLIFYRNGGMELADFRSAAFNRGPQPLPRLEGRPLAAAGWGLAAAVFLDTGRLLGLNGLSGEPIWSGSFREGLAGGEEPPSLIYDERGIYFLSKTCAAGFTGDGELLWRRDLEKTSVVPGFGDDGILYSGGLDWILSAFRMEDRVRRRPLSMYGPPPEGNYGAGSPPPSSWAGNPLRWEEELLEGRLRRIEEDISRGRVGDREIEYTAFLMETIDSGRDLDSPRPKALVQLKHRVRSLRLLALIGSGDTVPFLARIFEGEGESVVKAAAAAAIGAIGQDKEGKALRAFSNAVFKTGFPEDDQVLTAVALAAGSLCRFSGPPLSAGGIRILSALNSPGRSNPVRALAKQELEGLWK
ncbi:MAG: PQQ-like beta-propeller repeat protein [Treponema sp.]|nr:PQQ-like beta-propeller repeat protein [Treponema sp.]